MKKPAKFYLIASGMCYPCLVKIVLFSSVTSKKCNYDSFIVSGTVVSSNHTNFISYTISLRPDFYKSTPSMVTAGYHLLWYQCFIGNLRRLEDDTESQA